MTGTTPKALAIGAELRRAREEAGLSARQLATKLGKAHTTIGRWESGDRAPRPVDVATVLSALGASNRLRESLVELAKDPDERHWTAVSPPEQQFQLRTMLKDEREAVRITTVSPLLVPGILQTAEYARAIMVADEVDPTEADMRVAARVGRRDVLLNEKPAHLLAITCEHVLKQPIGGHAVLTEQLRALLFYADLRNVDLRVVPTRTGWHPGMEGPFSIREFKARPPVVSVEQRRGSQFLHEVDEATVYRDAARKVADIALSPADSTQLIAEVLDQTENGP